eukprot:gb/GFBE01015193.1/.p1 GENE.gb/GFBE01015193.1/~~gb/GFBE01015193.1/.p1  ORF type:complete len:419 (+),score=105.63 gb/GFBE01015193.1/:1-1257(+)
MRKSTTKETMLNRYVYQKAQVLGEGAFAAVYAGLDLQTNRKVAVKVYLADDDKAVDSFKKTVEVFLRIKTTLSSLSGDAMWQRHASCDNGILMEELSSRLSEEQAQSCARLVQDLDISRFFVELVDYSRTDTGHPGIDDASGKLFLIMEKGDQSLEERLHDRDEEQRLNADELKMLLWSLLCTMWALHTAGFVHTDIKPANIVYFSASKIWKLVDLDDVKKAGETLPLTDCVYTPVYMAPEMAVCEVKQSPVKISRTMDVWSVGMCGMYGIFLQPVLDPWYQEWKKETGSDRKFINWHSDYTTEPIISGDLKEMIAQIDPDICDLLSGMLQKDPQHRNCIPSCLIHRCFASIMQKLLVLFKRHEIDIMSPPNSARTSEDGRTADKVAKKGVEELPAVKAESESKRSRTVLPTQVCAVM